MKFLTRFVVLFYIVLVLYLSCFALLYVYNFENIQTSLSSASLISIDKSLHNVIIVITGAILFLNFVVFQSCFDRKYKGRTIAFDNPAGRVNVSLSALEELTKRVVRKSPEVKEVKSNISASRKGLHVKITLILRVEGSIPEITSRVQELVKRKVQDAIGLDEPIKVAIFVGKIIPDHNKEKRVSKKEKEIEEPPKEEEQNIPFQGYRA